MLRDISSFSEDWRRWSGAERFAAKIALTVLSSGMLLQIFPFTA